MSEFYSYSDFQRFILAQSSVNLQLINEHGRVAYLSIDDTHKTAFTKDLWDACDNVTVVMPLKKDGKIYDDAEIAEIEIGEYEPIAGPFEEYISEVTAPSGFYAKG